MPRSRKTVDVAVEVEDELDRLYGVALGDFVGERTLLSGALRKEGRRAEAEQVQELRKPSLSVWVVNQLARKRRKDVDLLLDAGHRLAVAQRALLTGGDKRAFDQASTAEREALSRLARAARSILGERASAATLERVTSTLRAAAVSAAARADLARGRLTTDVDLAGFEVFVGSPTTVATSPKPPAKPRRASSDDRAKRERAEREAAAKRAAIARSQAEVKSAKERQASLARKLREAEHAERAARTSHEQAERTVERVRADHEAAASALETARGTLEQTQRSQRR